MQHWSSSWNHDPPRDRVDPCGAHARHRGDQRGPLVSADAGAGLASWTRCAPELGRHHRSSGDLDSSAGGCGRSGHSRHIRAPRSSAGLSGIKNWTLRPSRTMLALQLTSGVACVPGTGPHFNPTSLSFRSADHLCQFSAGQRSGSRRSRRKWISLGPAATPGRALGSRRRTAVERGLRDGLRRKPPQARGSGGGVSKGAAL